MRTVFADTFYWLALANPSDQVWHKAIAVSKTLGSVRLITTDEILVEVLTFFSESGPHMRSAVIKLVRGILANPNTTVVPQTRTSFLNGLKLYEARLDKGYSLTDCVSMETMRENGIAEVLTHDNHFTQEGFVILL